MDKAVMIVNALPGYPFRGASAALNTYFADYLRRSNYSVRVIGVQSTYVPLNALEILDDVTAAGPVDLAVYCDLSQWLEPLSVVAAKRAVVFFHGLVGTPLVWMSRYFDALCCNSPWTKNVLRSLAGYPLWDRGTLLRPDIYQRSHHVRCPLPALGYPEGAISGEALPDEFFTRLDEDSGAFALDSFWEAHDQTQCHVIAAMNIVAREHGDARLYRLLVPPGKLEPIEQWLHGGHASHLDTLRARLRSLDLRVSDLFCPLPSARVRQADLFRLMKMCRFALMFNKIPESFGLMPLECVLNGCPVHSNGSGNLRHLLPPSHGITLHDRAPKVPLADWALETARSIYQHSLEGSATACAARQAELSRGRDYIRQTYTADAFEHDIGDVLDRCSRAQDASLPDLRLAKGPLVRRWDTGDVDIVSDTGVVRLTSEQEKRGSELLGSSATDLFHAAANEQALVSDLWRKGLLTWTLATAPSGADGGTDRFSAPGQHG
jgi:hypothetical protein